MQHEMVEKLEHARLQTVTLHNSQVEWYEKGKEIIVGSFLFDVHSYSRGNDSTVFTGLYDTEETEIKKHVKKLVEHTNENGARERVIGKLIVQLWCTNEDCMQYASLSSLDIRKKYLQFSVDLLSADISIPLPPPKA